jgi:hypothetical protein
MTNETVSEREGFVLAVEWPNQPGGVQHAARGSQMLEANVEKAINQAMGTINVMAHRVSQTVEAIGDKARPDEAEVDFGINLDVESGAVIAKTSLGAQLAIKLKWNIAEPERTKVVVSGQ